MREHIERILSYEELGFFAKKFAEGCYNFIAVFGPPGRLKSSFFRRAVGDKAHFVCGRATPFELFCELYEHRDRKVVLDDVAGMYDDPAGRRLLEAVTDPYPMKRVSWVTDAPSNRGTPKVFNTTSQVAIIDNNWGDYERLKPLEDRGRLFYFDPTPEQIHAEMCAQDWFRDEEVVAYVRENLSRLSSLSARTYVKAHEARLAGEDWKKYVLMRSLSADDMLLLALYSASDGDPASLVTQWMKQTGKTARDFDAAYERLIGGAS